MYVLNLPYFTNQMVRTRKCTQCTSQHGTLEIKNFDWEKLSNSKIIHLKFSNQYISPKNKLITNVVYNKKRYLTYSQPKIIQTIYIYRKKTPAHGHQTCTYSMIKLSKYFIFT